MKVKNRYSKDEIIKGIRNKESSVFQYITKENFRIIKQMILTNNGNESDANDIFQETLIVIYRKVQKSDFELTSSLNTYLYSIARLMWLKELRNRGRRPELTNEFESVIEEEKDVLSDIVQNERLKLFRDKFEELSDDCKKILKMFLDKIPIAEATHLMGYSSEQHTRNRRYRCKESLIKRIKASNEFRELGHGNNPIN